MVATASPEPPASMGTDSRRLGRVGGAGSARKSDIGPGPMARRRAEATIAGAVAVVAVVAVIAVLAVAIAVICVNGTGCTNSRGSYSGSGRSICTFGVVTAVDSLAAALGSAVAVALVVAVVERVLSSQ